MREVNELVNDALARWAAMVKVNPANRKKTIDQWQLDRQLEQLNHSRDLDPTGITTFMMLRGLTERYLKDISVTAFELILEPESIESELAPMRELRNMLEDEQVLSIIGGFQDRMRELGRAYKLSEDRTAELEKLLNKKLLLAIVRRDALLSMERLESFQFAQGQPGEQELKFNPFVYEFWNVNSVVAAMAAQRISGVTLVLIRDPEQVFASYFIFAIRNGETLTILTDREEGPHPAYQKMCRRPDRDLCERAEKHWFPYDLLDLELSEDGKQLWAKRRKDTLAPIGLQGVPIRPIAELEPGQFVWANLVFDRIRERYGRQNLLLPVLSYTGQMVVEPHAIAESSGALIKPETYRPLALAPLSPADVTGEATADQWESPCTGFYQWLEDRYSSQVPDGYLNVIGDKPKKLLEAKARRDLELSRHDDYFNKAKLNIETLSAVTFGPKEKLERDRRWAARVNKMRYIRALAINEYEREKEGAIKWFVDHVKANKKFILEAVARGSLILPYFSTYNPKQSFHHGYAVLKNKESLRQGQGLDFYRALGHFTTMSEGIAALYSLSYRSSYYICFIDGYSRATVYTQIIPNCPPAVARLAGVKLAELPWYFQNWYAREEPYSGNSILNRLDPQDWVLYNPWRELSLAVAVALCKTCYNRLRKEMGLAHKKFGKRKEDD